VQTGPRHRDKIYLVKFTQLLHGQQRFKSSQWDDISFWIYCSLMWWMLRDVQKWDLSTNWGGWCYIKELAGAVLFRPKGTLDLWYHLSLCQRTADMMSVLLTECKKYYSSSKFQFLLWKERGRGLYENYRISWRLDLNSLNLSKLEVQTSAFS
jgi:hypothetical protein